jgi:hypothetical protein
MTPVPSLHPPDPDFFFLFPQGDIRSAAHVPRMRPLHHAPHQPQPILLILPRPTLPHNVRHNLERVPRALLQPPVPQALREDAPAALPRAEPGERAPPRIREETRVDGAPRTRAVHRAAAPRTPTETGASAGRWWRRWGDGGDARGLERVLRACGPRNGGAGEGRLVRLRLKHPFVLTLMRPVVALKG